MSARSPDPRTDAGPDPGPDHPHAAGAGPDRYAVFGHPVAHSLSPRIHAAFAAQCGQAIDYTAIEAPLDGFAATARAFFAGGGRGANVTLPFKAQAFELAQRVDDHARRAGAANTLRAEPDGTLAAFNTDGPGLLRDLVVNHRCALAGARVLMVGAGGAAAGVLGPLLDARPAALRVVNRDARRAADLAARWQGAGDVQGGGLETAAGEYDLVLNASAAGHAGTVPALPGVRFAPDALAYDLGYGAAARAFLDWARAAGAPRRSDGLGMLVEQAAEAFLIWRGVLPETGPVLAALRAD